MNIEAKIPSIILHVITFATVNTACMPLNKNILSTTTQPDIIATVIQDESLPSASEIVSRVNQTIVPAPIEQVTATKVVEDDDLTTDKSKHVSTFTMTSTPKPASENTNQDTLQTIREMTIPENNLREVAMRLLGKSHIPLTVQRQLDYHKIDDQITFSATNLDTDEHFDVTAELVYRGPEVYFFTQTDLDVHKNMVSLETVMNNFETNIIPNVRKFFGQEWSPGIDGDTRLYILYTSGLGNSVGGYYASTDEYSKLAHQYSNEKEMFYINADTVDINDPYMGSILAHEFQHMVHWANDANEETWVNEGASVLAEMLNGFMPQVVDKAFASNPDLQLNAWSTSGGGADSIPHYGASFLFLNYFLDRFGDQATRALIAHTDSGFEAMNQVFLEMNIIDTNTGEPMTVMSFFADWLIANYIGDTSWSDGKYGYHNYPDAPLAISNKTMGCNSLSGQLTVHQYGVDYIETACNVPAKVSFVGSNQIGVADVRPHSGQFMFWSNRHDSCLLYTSPSPRDGLLSRMPSSA